MIPVTRLNGMPLTVNSELIRHIEAAPDTTLTLLGGEKIVVLESVAEVIDRTMAWRARLLAEAARVAPGGQTLMAPLPAAEVLAQVTHSNSQSTGLTPEHTGEDDEIDNRRAAHRRRT